MSWPEAFAQAAGYISVAIVFCAFCCVIAGFNPFDRGGKDED